MVAENQVFTFLPGRASATNSTTDADDDSGDSDQINELAQPDDNSVNERGVLNRHVERLVQRITLLKERLTEMASRQESLASSLDLPAPAKLQDISIITASMMTGERVAAAPDASADVFVASVWDQGVEQFG